MSYTVCFRRQGVLAIAVAMAAGVGCMQKHLPVVETPAPIVQVSQPLERPVPVRTYGFLFSNPGPGTDSARPADHRDRKE